MSGHLKSSLMSLMAHINDKSPSPLAISTIGQSICTPCANIDLTPGLPYTHSTVRELRKSANRGCSGCVFLRDAFQRWNVDASNWDEQPPVDITPHSSAQVILLSLRRERWWVRLVVCEGVGELRKEVGGVLLKLCRPAGLGHPLVDSDDQNPSPLGRVIAPHAVDDACFELGRAWFKQCTQHHGEACKLKPNASLPTRLVHIPVSPLKPLKLCETSGLHGQYVALSYCWGMGNTFKTTPETFNQRIKGFEQSDLPNLLSDAVTVARKMGFEWVWIDALCIIQGNQEDWERESSMMKEVYSNAAFTIAADVAKNTDMHMFHPRRVITSHTFGTKDDQRCLQTLEHYWERMCSMPLYRRGWAFQERILSSRTLHFLDDQIAWECNAMLYREGFHGADDDTRYELERTQRHFAKNQLMNYFLDRTFANSGLALDARIGRWNYLVQEIAMREFTLETDKFPGISGLASAIEVPEMGRYLAGTWEHNPFLSMAWFPRFSQKMPQKYIAPSWSWARTHSSQLVWYWATWFSDAPAAAMEDWNTWHAKWGPQLLSHHVFPKGRDPKGQILPGSHIVMRGFCRPIYLTQEPGTPYDLTFWVSDGNGRKPSLPGARVHIDDRRQKWESFASFFPTFSDLPQPKLIVNPGAAIKCVCVQIARERKVKGHNPKVLGLVLEGVGEEGAYRRVGVYEFEMGGYEQGWEERRLKLY